MRVGRVRLAPEAIDDPKLDPLDRSECRVGEFGDIGRVGKTADPQTERRAEAVVLRERNYRNPGNFERTDNLVRLQGRLVEPARLLRRLEDIPEALTDFG